MGNAEGKNIRDGALAGGLAAREAFARLWRGYYVRLSVFAASYRGLPSSEREDAVSEALIAAFRGLGHYDPERPLAPWVYRVAANRFADAARRARRVSSLRLEPHGTEDGGRGSDGFDPPASEDLEGRAIDRDLADRCRVALAALPGEDRRIAHLRFLEGMSAAEIGRALGVPAGTVRWRIHAIRKSVAEAVGELP